MRRIQVLGIAVSVAAIAWLFHAYDFSALKPLLWRIGAGHLAGAIACILCSLALRAVRWQLIFGADRPSFAPALKATLVGYTLNNVLPGRAGDLLKVYSLGSETGIAKGRILGTVVVEKVADVLVLLTILALVMFTFPLPGWFGYAVRALCVGAGVAVAVLATLLLAGRSTGRASDRVLRIFPARAREAIASTSAGFISGVRGLTDVWYGAGFTLVTALIWFVEIGIMFWISSGLGLGARPLDLLFTMIVIALGTMVPSSPGYIGTYELFGVQALSLRGFPRDASLAFVIALHGLIILGTTIPGAVALVVARRNDPRSAGGLASVHEPERV